MHIVHIEKTLEEIGTVETFDDVDALMEEYKLKDEPFDYLFELHEDEEKVVFAYLYGFDLTEEDKASGVGRVYQVETALFIKDIYVSMDYVNHVFMLGDNEGFRSLNSVLVGKPVWKKEELLNEGVEGFEEAGPAFAYRDYWRNYVSEE